MARFYENIPKFDMQEYGRRNREEGRKEGREEGVYIYIINQIYKKLQKGKSNEVIADEVEENVGIVDDIVKVIESTVDGTFDAEEVYRKWKETEVVV